MVGIILRSRISEKGQVVIPKPIRSQFNLKPNTEVSFSVENDKVVLEAKKGEEVLNEFITAIKKKTLPKKIDWDRQHYEQFD